MSGERPRTQLEPFTDTELTTIDAGFAEAPASEIIGWAVERFSAKLVIAASMTDAVLIDLAVRVDPTIEVVFLDTGYHFPQTLATVEVVRRRYDLNLRVLRAQGQAEGEEPWPLDADGCCSTIKVRLLDQALQAKSAWLSGLRRAEAATRANAPIVSRDDRGLVKVNPLALWTDADVDGYIVAHNVPVNPLLRQGYPSIGCQPCTQPAAPGAHPRSGRWVGQTKTECGLHERR